MRYRGISLMGFEMSRNPYQEQPNIAFWSRSVGSNFENNALFSSDMPYLLASDRIVSAGSCFASHIIPLISGAGYNYLRTEVLPDPFSRFPENLGYANFSARYGFIYTPRHLLQLYKRSIGEFTPFEYMWRTEKGVIDPFRPGLRYPAQSEEEFRMLQNQHLQAVRNAFESASVFIFTLGLTESWESKKDGAVFPACPGTVAYRFDSNLHQFHNFSLNEIVEDLLELISLLSARNPGVRFLITVSPVPLVATATKNHVLAASTYSKAVLRAAAETVVSVARNAEYLPAFEIVTGQQTEGAYFEADRRSVSPEGIKAVMDFLLSNSEIQLKGTIDVASRVDSPSALKHDANDLSRVITEADCDEAYLNFQ